MGSGYSSLEPTKALHAKIRDVVKNMLYKYEFWTSNDICDKLTIIYYDKLIQFKKSDLVDASAYIGIQYDDDQIDKRKLCKQIINHYSKRINLLKIIWDAIDRNYNKVYRSRNGPICRKVDKYVDDFFVCQKFKGLWLNKEQYKNMLKKIKKVSTIEPWLEHIKNLEDKWKFYLNGLIKIINKIKDDADNSMDNKTFDELKNDAMLVVRKMDSLCDVFYLLSINYV